MKEDRLKRLQTEWFQVYYILEKPVVAIGWGLGKGEGSDLKRYKEIVWGW